MRKGITQSTEDMKSLILLVCSILLLAAVSKGQTLNCNLRNGAGCWANGPNFYLDYKFTHSGPYSECKQAYNLKVQVPRDAEGFECSFVTDGSPQPNTYRYTISHDRRTYWDYYTPYIRVYGDDAFIRMAGAPSGIYEDNWWYHPNMHSGYGYSWANYRFDQRKLKYYSSETGIQHQSGHPYGFTPTTKTTYIGLNKRYGSNSYAGYGLCQVYCRIIQRSSADSYAGYSPRMAASAPEAQGAPGAPGAAASADGGENLSAPGAPSGPPAPPSGSGAAQGAPAADGGENFSGLGQPSRPPPPPSGAN